MCVVGSLSIPHALSVTSHIAIGLNKDPHSLSLSPTLPKAPLRKVRWPAKESYFSHLNLEAPAL